MADPAEPSSTPPSVPVPTAGPRATLEIVSLSKLSSDLERLVLDSPDCSDAEIVVDGVTIGIHRCILSARSTFFRDLFARSAGPLEGLPEAKPKYQMSELMPCGRVGCEAFVAILSYLYTGKLKPPPPEVSMCVDCSCTHEACRPAIDFAVDLMYASFVFQIPELVSLLEHHLLNFVEKALVEDVIPILIIAFHSMHSQLLSRCIQRLARSSLDSISLEKELPHEVMDHIKSIRHISDPTEADVQTVDPIHERRIRRIHWALDSYDIELLKRLLIESDVTLDEANALHFAAAYCDPKIVVAVLELGLANVNLKNERGYTPLHVAAMRKEPAVIMSLLTKGASASEPTIDGRSAVRICRRLTRAKDYYEKMKQGEESNKDRLCIDILEGEMRKDPMTREELVTLSVCADDLHMKLLYLENRVAFASLYFPTQAKLAMKVSQTESTSVYLGYSAAKSSGNLREVELNESSIQNEKLCLRLDALMKTVELGRRYFPHCSQVLDKLLEYDVVDFSYLKEGTPDEKKIKRMRFYELKEEIQEAILKDNTQNGYSGLSSSTSSSLPKRERKQHMAARKCIL